MEGLPSEILTIALGHLAPADLCRAARVSRGWRDAADPAWETLAERLDDAHFLLGLSDLLPPCDAAAEVHGRPGCRYRALLRQERASARVMCLDYGRGYAKFGLARNSAPAPIQICTPASEASEATTVRTTVRCLGPDRRRATRRVHTHATSDARPPGASPRPARHAWSPRRRPR